MLLTARPRGFTLIELMVGLAILAILAMLVAPTLAGFIGNTRIRSTADSIANGIRQASVEAIKRNGCVEFALVPAVGWELRALDDCVPRPPRRSCTRSPTPTRPGRSSSTRNRPARPSSPFRRSASTGHRTPSAAPTRSSSST